MFGRGYGRWDPASGAFTEISALLRSRGLKLMYRALNPGRTAVIFEHDSALYRYKFGAEEIDALAIASPKLEKLGGMVGLTPLAGPGGNIAISISNGVAWIARTDDTWRLMGTRRITRPKQIEPVSADADCCVVVTQAKDRIWVLAANRDKQRLDLVAKLREPVVDSAGFSRRT